MSTSLNATVSEGEDEPGGAAPPPPGRRALPSWLIPAVLAAAWAAVLLAHLRAPVPSDQLNYLLAAERFPHRVEPTTEMHQMTRFGLIVPARLAIAVFGYSQAAYATVPILATLALLAGTYALGTLLFARTVGAAGALLVVAATPVFTDSTDLLPDILAVGLFTCALALAVALRRRPGPPGVPVLLLLGALLGWSYLAREFIVFVWPVVPALLYRRVGWKGLVWVAVPVAVLFAAETVLCWRLYGDPLARLLAVSGHGQRPSTPAVAASYRDKPRMTYVMRLPDTLGTYPEGRVLVGLLVLTVAGAVLRVRRVALLFATCALLWVPLTLLGGVIDPAAPKLRLQLIRYWFPVFPGFVLGGLGLLWLAAARLPGSGRLRAALPAAVVVAVAAVGVGTAARAWWGAPSTRLGGATQMEDVRSWMRAEGAPDRRLWSDPHTRKVLTVYREGAWGGAPWPGRLLAARPGGDRPAPGDLVLLYDTERGRVCPLCRASARAAWGDPVRPGPGWRELHATRDGVARLYRVG